MKRIALALALLAFPVVAQAQVVSGRVAVTPPAYVDGETRPITLDGSGALRTTASASSAASAAVAPAASSSVGNSLILKASGANLYSFHVTSGASAGYILLFNSATVPADGAVTPVGCWALAANSTFSTGYHVPARLSNGAVLVFSTTGCFTKTASATAFFSGVVQ